MKKAGALPGAAGGNILESAWRASRRASIVESGRSLGSFTSGVAVVDALALDAAASVVLDADGAAGADASSATATATATADGAGSIA